MGYPLYIAAVGAAYWVVRRVRHQLPRHLQDELDELDESADPNETQQAAPPSTKQAEHEAEQQPEPARDDASADDSAANRRFGLG